MMDDLSTFGRGLSVSPSRKSPSRRLIDEGLLQYEASQAGLAERYARGETSHTIHVWWARRPHTAMRALVFASLCKGDSLTAQDILIHLCSSTVLPQNRMSEAQSLLNLQYGGKPRILD